MDLIFSCRFNYYDVNVHHPQTAAEALIQMERVQQRDRNLYRFPFTPEISVHTRKSHHYQPSYVVQFPQNVYYRH